MLPGLTHRGLTLLLTAATFASANAAALDADGVPVPTPVSAQAAFHDASLLQDLAGRWSGIGSALYTDGSSERLRCVATYVPERLGTAVHQVIRCKGTAMDLKLGGAWAIKDGSIAGTWTEETYSLSGSLNGQAAPAGFDVKATSTFADVSVAVRMSGCTQDITMTFSQQIDRMHLALHKC